MLNEQEINFIRHTIIKPDITNKNTQEYSAWENLLNLKIIRNEATEEEVHQYYRLREIENFFTLISGFGIPETMKEIDRRFDEHTIDSIERDFLVKVLALKSVDLAEDGMMLAFLEKHFVEVEEQSIEEPFIKDLINDLHHDNVKKLEYERTFEMIKNVGFAHLSQNDMSMICLMLLKELKKPLDEKIRFIISQIDPKMLAYLTLRFGITFTNTNDNTPNNNLKQ